MIILERDGSLLWYKPDDPTSEYTKELVDVPAALVTQPNNIIDRILDFVFDTLGLRAVELRIREDIQAAASEALIDDGLQTREAP